MHNLLILAMSGFIALPQLRVAINIPANRADVYIADSLVRSMPVSVGMPRFPTPRGAFEITTVEWNPWWIPPDSPWAAREPIKRPGPTNPMGRVKLNFRPLYFLHGTPSEHSLGTAASHGCVRMKNGDALALAALVLRYGAPTLSAAETAKLLSDTVHTRLLALALPIPLEIGYRVVELRGERLTVYRDIYGLARRSLRDEIYAALASAGADTTQTDPTRVRALLRRIPPAGNSIDIDALRAWPAAPTAQPPTRRR